MDKGETKMTVTIKLSTGKEIELTQDEFNELFNKGILQWYPYVVPVPDLLYRFYPQEKPYSPYITWTSNTTTMVNVPTIDNTTIKEDHNVQ